MQPHVGSIVGDNSQDRLVPRDKTENCDQTVDNTEDAKEQNGSAFTGHAADDRHDACEQMHCVMRGIDVKNAEQMLIRSDRRNEAKNPHQDKHRAEDQCDGLVIQKHSHPAPAEK